MIVTDDDRLVVLWEKMNFIEQKKKTVEKFDGSYYMILASNGKVLKKATPLKGIRLNACEEPIYANGAVYWVSGTGTDYKAAVKKSQGNLYKLKID
jgi:hypothetical protein